jgi:uncharacterized membrane protein
MRLADSMIVNKAKYISATCGLVGSIVLLIAIYVFVNRVTFLLDANASSAPIVSVAHEYVPAGRGSLLAYVPTVQVRDAEGNTREMKVNTSNKEPIYAIGQQLRVMCNLDRGCIEDSFFAKWGDCLIDLLISLLFFLPLLAWKFGLWRPNSEITALKLQRDA